MIEGVDSSPRGELDLGSDRDANQELREALCCARMPGNTFCTKDDGHDGDHGSHAPPRDIPANDFGPNHNRSKR